MANTVYIMEAGNLFCGDHDPSASNSSHWRFCPQFEQSH
jgi:hypothetical protein